MSFAEVKEQVANLTDREQRELAAYIVGLREATDADLKRFLAQKIDDEDPNRWVPVEDVISMLEKDPSE